MITLDTLARPGPQSIVVRTDTVQEAIAFVAVFALNANGGGFEPYAYHADDDAGWKVIEKHQDGGHKLAVQLLDLCSYMFAREYKLTPAFQAEHTRRMELAKQHEKATAERRAKFDRRAYIRTEAIRIIRYVTADVLASLRGYTADLPKDWDLTHNDETVAPVADMIGAAANEIENKGNWLP